MKILPFVFLLLLLVAPSPLSFDNDASALSVSYGKKAPEFTLMSVEGESLSSTRFIGSITILVYWNPEQRHSLTTLKDLQDIHERYRHRGVEVVSVIADAETWDKILHIIHDLGITFRVLLDPEREFYGNFGVHVYPSTIILDREGNVADSLPGHALSYKVKVESTIRFILGEISREEREKMLSLQIVKKNEAVLASERRYNLAIKFIEMQLYEQAMFVAQQAINSFPGNPKSHTLLGFLFLETDQSDKAQREFLKALEIDPLSHDAKTGLGAAFTSMGETERAISILREALKENPYPQRTYYELGRAYEMKGDKEQSRTMYRKMLEQIAQHHILPSSFSRCD